MTKEEKTLKEQQENKNAPKKEGEVAKVEEKKGGGAALTESDIALFKRYGKGPYADAIKKVDDEFKDLNQKISTLCGIKESDTGLALPSQWNLQQDMMMLKQDPTL